MKLRSIDDIEKEKLESKLEDSIFLRAIDFGLAYPDGFTYEQIMKGLALEGPERKVVDEYLNAAFSNAYSKRSTGTRGVVETPFFVIEDSGNYGHINGHKYIISFDAHFKFIDYHELKFARQNAKEARNLATIAIAVSIGAALASIVMPIFVAQWFTQNVKIDSVQLQSLMESRPAVISNP